MVGQIFPAQNSGLSGSGEVFYPAQASQFAATSQIALSVSGVGTTSQLLVSFWFKTASGSNQYIICGNGSAQFVIGMNPNVYIFLGNGSGSIQALTAATFNDNAWHHCLVSSDTNFSSGSRKLKMYIDNVDVTNIVTDTGSAFSLNYQLSLPLNISGTTTPFLLPFAGGVSEVFFFPGVYLDLTILANRRKFITASRRPAFLGTNGKLPTGNQPLTYLKGSGSAFNVNSGSDGNFTVAHGSLTTPTTTPSNP